MLLDWGKITKYRRFFVWNFCPKLFEIVKFLSKIYCPQHKCLRFLVINIHVFPYHSAFQNVLKDVLIRHGFHFMKINILMVDCTLGHSIRSNDSDKKFNFHQFWRILRTKYNQKSQKCWKHINLSFSTNIYNYKWF